MIDCIENFSKLKHYFCIIFQFARQKFENIDEKWSNVIQIHSLYLFEFFMKLECYEKKFPIYYFFIIFSFLFLFNQIFEIKGEMTHLYRYHIVWTFLKKQIKQTISSFIFVYSIIFEDLCISLWNVWISNGTSAIEEKWVIGEFEFVIHYIAKFRIQTNLEKWNFLHSTFSHWKWVSSFQRFQKLNIHDSFVFISHSLWNSHSVNIFQICQVFWYFNKTNLNWAGIRHFQLNFRIV